MSKIGNMILSECSENIDGRLFVTRAQVLEIAWLFGQPRSNIKAMCNWIGVLVV